MDSGLAALQACVANRLPAATAGAEHLAGIIGDHPSQYAKSPSLWNAAFKTLQLDAVYLPFDVEPSRLAGLVGALRRCNRLLGVNVTMPHKMAITKHLDRVDAPARRIGAVNTVVRTHGGRLVGYNTDGSGFLRSLTEGVGGEAPLLPTLQGVNALLIGAGGSARAVALALAGAIGRQGRLIIANRTKAAAVSLAGAMRQAKAIGEEEIPAVIAGVGLVVNCSTKGQAGPLERYSALAPANAATDIRRNHRLSREAARALPKNAVAYDAIYAPPETVFLRHCRMTGHRTANGQGMNIAQAVEAFPIICGALLRRGGLDARVIRQRVAAAMARAW